MACTDEDTYYDLKVKIQAKKGLQEHDIDQWHLYRPGDFLDKTEPFVPKTGDYRLPPKHRIKHTDKDSGDPNIDIVIFVRQQRQQPQQKKSIEALAATGTPPLHPSLSQN